MEFIKKITTIDVRRYNSFNLFILILPLLLIACEEPLAKLPVLTTIELTEIEDSTAVSGGDISTDGGFEISARGVCWNTSPNPTTNNFKTNDAAGTGSYVSKLTNLTPSTTYYVRSYATNKNGTAYGLQLEFKTKPKQSWRRTADFPKSYPVPFGFGIGNKGYVLAYSSDDNVLYEYDPLLNTWTSKAGCPLRKRSYDNINTFSINNKIYVFITGDNNSLLYEYNPTINSWSYSSLQRENSTRISTFTINNKAYIIYHQVPTSVGNNYIYTNIFWEFDPQNPTSKWVKKSNYPANSDASNNSTTCFSINNKGYALDNGKLYIYEQSINKWSLKSNVPHFVSRVPSVFVLNNKVYIGAGHSSSSYSTKYKDFWEYNPELDTWKQIDDFGGAARSSAASFIVNNKAYFGMGYTNDGYTDDFWRFIP